MKFEVKKLRRNAISYKNEGPWEIKYHVQEFFDELDELKEIDEHLCIVVGEILKELETKPFQGSYEQHPLWQFEAIDKSFVVWSAVIDEDNRLNYLICKDINVIIPVNCVGHRVLDKTYSEILEGRKLLNYCLHSGI